MEADPLGATLNLLGATLLDPGPPPEASPQANLAAADAAPVGPASASGVAQVAPRGTAARPMLALTDTAPPPLGLHAAGPAAVTLVEPAPRPAALASAIAVVDPALVRLVELTNAERAAVGVAPLTGNLQLTLAAQRYAEVMADTACFGHACGPFAQLGDRAWAAGDARWGFLGENVAAGQPTPERVVAGWMASPAHRTTLLNPEFTLLGVGRALGGPYGTYWAQEFGTPSGGAPAAAPALPAAAVDHAVALLNVERAGAGLRPLRLDVRLIQPAQEDAADRGAAPPGAGAVLHRAGAGDAGRMTPTDAALPDAALLGAAHPGPSPAEEAVAQWQITAHDLLLDPQYTAAGVGVVSGTPGHGQDQVYWTETLAGSAVV